MSDDKREGATYTGKVLVRCDVLVDMAGDTGCDVHILRVSAEEFAMAYVDKAVNKMASELEDARFPTSVCSAKVVQAAADEMTISWSAEKS